MWNCFKEGEGWCQGNIVIVQSAQRRIPTNNSVPIRKGRGTAEFGKERVQNITMCTQFCKNIGAFITNLYTYIIRFLGALTQNSRFDSCRT